jgi:hypothetical protein
MVALCSLCPLRRPDGLDFLDFSGRARFWGQKDGGTLGLSEGYGVGNPRESVSGQFTSLVNWGEQVNSPYSLGEQDIPS